jgi:hypothetical protein
MAENYESGDDKKTKFTEIGALWPTTKGKGWRGKLKATPVDGEILILPNEPKAS